MSKDDRKAPSPANDDPAYITMPPELRPYVRKLDNKVVRRGDDPIRDAAVAALKMLNGGPDADPLYYDVKKEQAAIAAKQRAAAPGIGNASAYVALTEVPAAAPGVVEGAEVAKVVVTGGEEARPEAPASPWSKDAKAPGEVRASALPSSLRPRDRETVVSAKIGGRPARDRRRATAITIALIVVGVGVGVAVLTSKRGDENGAREPAPSATPTAPAPSAPEVMAPVIPAPVEAVAPPAVSATASAAVRAAPNVVPSVAPAPERPRMAPKVPSPVEDPYRDAAVTPPAVVTAVPVAPPTTMTVAPVAPPPVPPTPPSPPVSTDEPASPQGLPYHKKSH